MAEQDNCFRSKMGLSCKNRLASRLEESWCGARPSLGLRLPGYLYGLVALARRQLYGPLFKVERADVPVVSLGNLTVGGTGKTPMSLALAKGLLDRGYHPAVLSRGYGRQKNKEAGPTLVVSQGQGPEVTALESGDEPWLMASELPGLRVVVDANRARGAQAAIRDLGANILLLDDGYQHLKLAADCRILLIPAHNPWGNGAVIPAGPLREPLAAHKLADILVTTGAARPSPETVAWAGARPVFAAQYHPLGWVNRLDGLLKPVDALGAHPAFAFCGLGRPEGFLKSLQALGVNVWRFAALGDHQKYDQATLEWLSREFLASGAQVAVTTAKDAVKLGDAPFPLKILKSEMALDQDEEFVNTVLAISTRNFEVARARAKGQ